MAAKLCVNFELLSIEEFCDIVMSNHIEDDAVQVFCSNKTDGSIFLEMTAKDFKELRVVSLGHWKKMEHLKTMATNQLWQGRERRNILKR